MSTFKVMLMGYFLPLLLGAVVSVIPEYDSVYTKISIGIFGVLLLLPIVLVFKYPKKREKAYKLTLMFQLYTFTLFMAFPLFKVLNGSMLLQLLLVIGFIAMYYLARADQQTEVPIVFPKSDKDRKWFTYVYYAIPAVLTILGFNGNHIVMRNFFERFGDAVMFPYMSVILYIFSCWLLFLFSSLAYQSHVVEGFLEK